MIQACDELDIIRMKNSKNSEWINRDIYRLLYNPSLFVIAYERIKSKPGNMTPGIDGKTLDGFSLDWINQVIEILRNEQYNPKPVRRSFIPKGEKLRPLGIPSPREKVLQECLHLILEAIFEPLLHENSHGFRPGRSCHTALESLRCTWKGTKWAIKLDISECFEKIDHHKLLDTLREKIEDDRFINLIRKFLSAGYIDNWKYHKTYSGTPQGSIISPILTNCYLNKLDQKLEEICQCYSKGKKRKANPEKAKAMRHRKKLLNIGEKDVSLRSSLKEELKKQNKQLLSMPSSDPYDSGYTRVRFLRYADDITVGVIGSRILTQKILDEIDTFLEENLGLMLNKSKTKIVHLLTEKVDFLGYQFKTSKPQQIRKNMQDKKSPHNVTTTVNTGSGGIYLLVPLGKLRAKLSKYMTEGKPSCLYSMVNQPIETIIEHYNSVIRGWYNFYQMANNVCYLNYARYVLKYSLVKTLAHKLKMSVAQIFRKFGKQIVYKKTNGKKTRFFNQLLRKVKWIRKNSQDMDYIPNFILRLTCTRLYDNCAVCHSKKNVEMHHIRHIRGHSSKKLSGFNSVMGAINRKQIPVCRLCHQNIHNGKYDGKSLTSLLEILKSNPGIGSNLVYVDTAT